MNHKIKVIILLFLVAISCKKDEPSNLFTFSYHTEEFKGVCDKEDCAKVIIDYVKVNGDTEAATKINYVLGGSIIYFLNADIDKKVNARTIAEASDVFLKAYENDVKQFPEISPYVAEVSVTKSFASPSILSFETDFSSFTGGAHGYKKMGFLNFDPITGHLLLKSSFFKNKQEFLDFAEQLFRKKYEIPHGDNINSTGFWFKKDKFHLPENIGFSEENMILIYNPYEIASYSDGVIELLIPMKDAKDYLTF